MEQVVYKSPFVYEVYPVVKKNDIPQEIKNLSELKDGWDFGHWFGIHKKTIEKGCLIYNHFERNEFKYAVGPTSSGGIKITAQIDVHFLDLTINSDLTIDITHEIGIGADYDTVFEKKNVNMEEIETHLNELLIQSCFLSERYTSGSIIQSRNDSMETHLKTSIMVYPLLTWTAQSETVEAYALT